MTLLVRDVMLKSHVNLSLISVKYKNKNINNQD